MRDADRRRGALDRRRGRGPLPRRVRRRAARRPARGVPRAGRGAARAARAPLRAHARAVHDRARSRAATRVDLGPVLRELERAGDLVRGELRPGGTEREWCDPEVLRRLRRASLAALRKEVEPAEQRALARFLPAWQGVDASPPARRGRRPPARDAGAAPGPGAGPEVWERDVLPRRVGAYSPAWLDQLCAGGELVWVGAGRARPQRPAGWRSTSARTRRWLGPPPFKGDAAVRAACTTRIRERLERGAAFWTDLLADLGEVEPAELQEALWDLVWAGEVTNDAFAPLRAPRLSLAPADARSAGRALRRAAAGRARRRSRAAGRSPRRCSPTRPRTAPRMRALAELLLERYGIVTRETVLAEGIPGGFAGAVRRAGEPGDARHRAPRLLRRGPGRRAVRAAGGGRAAARPAHRRAGGRRSCWPPPIRPTPTARRCRGRSARTTTRAAARARVPGRLRRDARRRARAVRRARRQGPGGAARARRRAGCAPALEALADDVRRGRLPRAGASSASTASRWWAPRLERC